MRSSHARTAKPTKPAQRSLNPYTTLRAVTIPNKKKVRAKAACRGPKSAWTDA